MAGEGGGEARCGIGTRLRSARERKNLTVLQAAERLHVDARILEALEAEDFASLGAPVFARGHLRHYAELVGEPVAELQELYTQTIRTAPPDLTRIVKATPQNDPGRLFVPAVVVLGSIALIGIIWWVISLSGDRAPSTQLASRAGLQGAHSAAANGAADSGTPKVAAGSEAAGQAVARAPDSAQTSIEGNIPSDTGGSRQAATARTTAADGTAHSAGVMTSQPHQIAAMPSGRPQYDQPPPAPGAAPAPAAQVQPAAGTASMTPVRAREAELTLKFSGDSWAEVYDAAGQRLFYDVGAASSEHKVRGVAPLRVVLGNASGVEIDVDGHPAAIKNGLRPDGSAQFYINPRGRATRVKPIADGG